MPISPDLSMSEGTCSIGLKWLRPQKKQAWVCTLWHAVSTVVGKWPWFAKLWDLILNKPFSVLYGAKSFRDRCYFSASSPSSLLCVRCVSGTNSRLHYQWPSLCRRTHIPMWFSGHLPGFGEGADSSQGLCCVCITVMMGALNYLGWQAMLALVLLLVLAS